MQLKKIPDVEAIRGGEMHKGDLHLTEHHIVFVMPNTPEAGAKLQPNVPKTRELYIAYPILNYCNFRPSPPASGRTSTVRIRGRDFTFISFHFKDDGSAREAFELIRNRTCRLGSIEQLYAFSYQPLKQEKPFNGWEMYDPKVEFRRQGISSKSQDRGWRISNINKDYAFSPTYPGLLVVPSQISDNVIKHAGPYRSRQRIPVLTYLHSLNNCSITRSSQPCVGLRGNRSPQDERIVSASFSASATVEFNGLDVPATETAEPSPATSQADIRDPSLDSESLATAQLEDELIAAGDPNYDPKTGKRLIFGAQQSNLIVDARPTINAVVMQAMGKGSENMDYYNFAKKAYLNIDNIHVMRESLNTVIEAIKDGDISRLPPNRELLQKSAWLKHITGVLDGSALIARQVGIRHSHVLIHCSDGWDRTSQLSALSQLMLDPFYRTIEGFIILVEKDWLSFGHMFFQRSGPLNHEKWFTVERDAMAGGTLQPGESDGRAGEAFEKAFASATRFFNKKNTHKDENVDPDDSPSPPDDPSQIKRGEGEATRPNEISPVFHQFLDSTYQLLRQHPTRFEFNERFLRRLLYHLYSAQYGTFLWNSEKARKDAKAAERTRSVWGYFLSRKQEFSNPEYDATVDDRQSGRERLIFPRLGEIRWWASCFGRADAEMNEYLDAAAARGERVNNYSTNVSTSPAPGSRSRSPIPPHSSTPGLKASTSVLTGVETAHEALTPDQGARDGRTSLKKSASADTPGAFTSNLAKLRDGVAGLEIGKGLFGGGATSGPHADTEATENNAGSSETGKPLQEMTDLPVPTPPLGDNSEQGLEMT
ncbi:putative Myotubularin phosphatase domain-containing protein [Seiridium cardinale]|uniref:Myotubularin phosphatase domain-containing protein n=1 Tax=Seiridium cardinale TaxID=138064 RepID=A0ABR2XFH7_9PEZI